MKEKLRGILIVVAMLSVFVSPFCVMMNDFVTAMAYDEPFGVEGADHEADFLVHDETVVAENIPLATLWIRIGNTSRWHR